MSVSFSTRLSLGIAKPFVAYCDDAGLTKSEVMARALSEFLATHKPRPTAYELALPLIPKEGLPHLQAKDAKRILREKFRASARAR